MGNYIIGVDPSLTSTGVAVIDMETEEVLYVKRISSNAKDTLEVRITYIVNEVLKIKDKFNFVKKVYLEDPYCGVNKNTTIKLCKLRGAFDYALITSKVDFKGMTPASVRSLLCDKGNTSKEGVAMIIQSKYKDNPLVQELGEFCDKSCKKKNSDIYDAISVAIAGVAYDRRNEG